MWFNREDLLIPYPSARLSQAGGAYVFVISLLQPTPLPPTRFDGLLSKGIYAYVGSAYGPGGIRARCLRHFSRNKARHWHVDWLTANCESLNAFGWPGGKECDLVRHLLSLRNTSVAIIGFGNSDCQLCPSHLLRLEKEVLKTFVSLTSVLGESN